MHYCKTWMFGKMDNGFTHIQRKNNYKNVCHQPCDVDVNGQLRAPSTYSIYSHNKLRKQPSSRNISFVLLGCTTITSLSLRHTVGEYFTLAMTSNPLLIFHVIYQVYGMREAQGILHKMLLLMSPIPFGLCSVTNTKCKPNIICHPL